MAWCCLVVIVLLERFLLVVHLGLCHDPLTAGGVLRCGLVCVFFCRFLVTGCQEGFALVYLRLIQVERVKLLGQLEDFNLGLLRDGRGLSVVQLEPLGLIG